MEQTTDKKQILSQALNESLEKVMNEAKVPYKVHLAVIKRLEQTIKTHNEEIAKHQNELSLNENSRKAHERHIAQHNAQIQSYQDELQRHKQLLKGEKGDVGRPGKDAEEVDVEALTQDILSRIKIPDPVEGKPGKDAEIDEDKLISKMIDTIRKKQLIDTSHIKGLTDHVKNVSSRTVSEGFMKNGVKYKFEELMHGGGSGSSSTTIYIQTPSGVIDGVNKVYTTTNTITTVIGLWYNGEFIHPSEYTVSGAGFTMATALPVFDPAGSFTISYT